MQAVAKRFRKLFGILKRFLKSDAHVCIEVAGCTGNEAEKT